MDLKIIETGSGGDIVLKSSGRDFEIVDGLHNVPYLSMFGGNVEQSTPNERPEEEQGFDWWGNSVLMPNQPNIQFNSETERTLMRTPLGSAGLQKIFEAVKNDLLHMKAYCTVFVGVAIPDVDRVAIGVRLQEPANLTEKQFMFIWDATKNEVNDVAPSTYSINYVKI